MTTNFKRAFIGYRNIDVQKILRAEQNEYEKKIEEYSEELAKLQKIKNKLVEEKGSLEKQLDEYKSLRKKIETMLIKAHLEACSDIYKTEEQFDEMINYKTDMIKNQQNKNIEIKESINKLLDQLHLIVNS